MTSSYMCILLFPGAFRKCFLVYQQIQAGLGMRIRARILLTYPSQNTKHAKSTGMQRPCNHQGCTEDARNIRACQISRIH